MGYESNVIIVKRNEYTAPHGRFVFGEQIAQFRMSNMGAGFSDLFRREGKEIDFDLYIRSGDEGTMLDYYGEHCKMIELSTLADYLKEQINNGDNYRRLKPLLALIEAFDPEQWEAETPRIKEHLYAVHFGY